MKCDFCDQDAVFMDGQDFVCRRHNDIIEARKTGEKKCDHCEERIRDCDSKHEIGDATVCIYCWTDHNIAMRGAT